MLFVAVVEVNAFAQGALRRFTQWPWIEYPTFQSGGGHSTTELIAALFSFDCKISPLSLR